jgi:hypothetical protein
MDPHTSPESVGSSAVGELDLGFVDLSEYGYGRQTRASCSTRSSVKRCMKYALKVSAEWATLR